jgi:hypothetical protein
LGPLDRADLNHWEVDDYSVGSLREMISITGRKTRTLLGPLERADLNH